MVGESKEKTENEDTKFDNNRVSSVKGKSA